MKCALFYVVLQFLACTLLACAERPDPIRQQVQAAYDKMCAAAERKDVDGWLALKTPDFVSVSLDGKETTLASRRALMKLVFAAMQTVRARVRILAFKRLSADEARATIHDRTEMTFIGQKKRPQTMLVDTIAEATWVRTSEGWREKRSRSLREKATVDGKPLPGA